MGRNNGTTTASYFDSDVSNRPATNDNNQTTSALQTPTDYTGIYADWNVNVDGVSGPDNPWDFGTASQYPALKADWDGDMLTTAYEFGVQERSAPPPIEDILPLSASVGTEIKIAGSGLSSTTTEDSVSFD